MITKRRATFHSTPQFPIHDWGPGAILTLDDPSAEAMNCTGNAGLLKSVEL